MSGAIVAGAVVAAGASAYSARQQRKANDRANQAANQPSSSQSYPWEASSPYRQHAMDLAYRQLLGQNPLGQERVPDALRGSLGASPAPTNGAGGGGGRKASTPSGSRQMADWLSELARNGSPYDQSAQDYYSNLSSGGDAQNPYRRSAAGRLESSADQYSGAGSNLEQFIGQLFGGQLPGGGGLGGGSGSGGGSSRGSGSYYGGGGAPTTIDYGAGPVGAAGFIRDILGGQYLDGNPHLEGVIGSARRDVEDSVNRGLLGRLGDMAAGGAYGGSSIGDAYTDATAELSQRTGDLEGQLRFGDYNARMGDLMSALGLGTDLDVAQGNSSTALAQSDMAARASASSAAAGRASVQDEIASRERIAGMGALLEALGLQQGGEQFAIGGLGSLGAQLGDEQLGAFGVIPDIGNMDMDRGLGAFGAQFSLDQLDSQNRARSSAQRAAERARQDEMGWRAYLYEQNAAEDDLSWFTNIINGASDGYGTNVSQGPRQYIPYNGPSEVGAGLSGAISGAQLGSWLNGLFENRRDGVAAGGAGGVVAPGGGGYYDPSTRSYVGF